MTDTPKKRFTEEEQIIKAIDRTNALIIKRSKESEVLDDEATKLFQAGDFDSVAKAKRNRVEAKKKRERVMIARQKANRLGQKLSEFRTATIPVVTTDTSVQA